MLGRFLLKFSLLCFIIIVATVVYLRFAPARYHILKPIDLTEKPTLITDMKLRFASRDVCYQALRDAQIEIEPLPDEVKGKGCEFQEVVHLKKSLVRWGGGITLQCPTLAGVMMWERHALVPGARDILGSEVVRVHHYGTYSCRNINNASKGRRSQHASANAVDISGFTLADGRKISVLKDWDSNSDEAEFLHYLRKKACKRFNTVLSPDYNALHKDHFHFDNGPFLTCR